MIREIHIECSEKLIIYFFDQRESYIDFHFLIKCLFEHMSSIHVCMQVIFKINPSFNNIIKYMVRYTKIGETGVIVKISILPKWINKFNPILINIPKANFWFCKLIPKFIWKNISRITKMVLKLEQIQQTIPIRYWAVWCVIM